jgi:Flp pilus assembly protein TadG
MTLIPSRVGRTARERGVAAVEFALLAVLLVVLLVAPLSLGRILWHYTVMQKAAHDATRYLAQVPDGEMRTPALVAHVERVARAIVSAEMADLNPGNDAIPVVTVQCNGVTCGGSTSPSTVRVHILLEVSDPFFRKNFGGEFGLPLNAESTLRSNGTK